MGQKQDTRTLYTISCGCGARVTLDARAFGRPQVCKNCGGSFTVGWGKDPKSRKSTPVAVTLARKRAPTPLQVVCACGYRRAVTPMEAAGSNRCPGCGRSMIVEKPVSQKAQEGDLRLTLPAPPSRPPAPQAPPRSAPDSVRVVELAPEAHAFDCQCGERLLVRTHTIGNLTQCPACDRKMRVEMKKTPAAATALVPGGRTPTPPPGGKTPTPVPYSFTKPQLTCECGETLEIVKAFDASGTVCTACGRTVTMEKIRAPQSKHTVIRPRFGPKTPAAPAPPPTPEPGAAVAGPVTESVEEHDAVVPSRSSYQEVFCPCGEALMVGTEDVGKNMQCPTCLTLMAVDQLREPHSSNMVIRVRAIGKMDQDTWSLSDFA
ncbi:MAG TPA: hypothetical protein VMU54_04225 [Planctomycetota bacterium]|nr:hypothetical protein [Planctomycetota bacterium]